MAKIEVYECDLCGKLHKNEFDMCNCKCECDYQQGLEIGRDYFKLKFNEDNWKDILEGNYTPFYFAVEHEGVGNVYCKNMSYNDIQDWIECLETISKKYKEMKDKYNN